MEEERRVAMLGDLAVALELPLSFIRAIELLKKERSYKLPFTDEDRKILWAAEQGLRQIEAVRLVVDNEMLLAEPVAVRGVLEEVMTDFGQFWRLVGEAPTIQAPKKQLLVDVNRRTIKCLLASLLAESLQFSRSGQVFAEKTRGGIRIGVRDFGPALPRNFCYQENQILPLRPKSRAAFLVINELVRGMDTRLETISHLDGVSFFVNLQESRQARLW
jgi:hypothetical protein